MMKFTNFLKTRGLTQSGVVVSGSEVALSGAATDFLNGTGTFSVPGGGGGSTFDGQGTVPGGRLTLTTSTPVTTSNVTAAGTLYYTPYINNKVATYSGSVWVQKTFSEISLALTIASGSNYDVFVNSAATTLSLSAAWSNDTTRTDAVTTQDGVTVLSSDHTKLWLGTIRGSGANVTEDSTANRYVWNAYNRVPRNLSSASGGANGYAVAVARPWANDSTLRASFVVGFAQSIMANIWADMTAAASTGFPQAGIGVDSTTVIGGFPIYANNTTAGVLRYAYGTSFPLDFALGKHYLQLMQSELGAASSTFNSGGVTARLES